MPAIQMESGQIPAAYRRFATAIGESHWQGAVARQELAIKANPFLGPYLKDQYAIAYQLDKLRGLKAQLGTIPLRACDDQSTYPAMGFVAQALEVMDRSTTKQARAFVRRVRTAIADAANMHGLRLELQAASHFTRRGHRVSWPKTTSEGTFDLFVEDLGASGLEIECKAISEDKGRRIHRREALEFWGALFTDLGRITRNLESGLAVVLTVPYRLPDDPGGRASLARHVVARSLAGEGARMADGTDLRVSEFDPARIKAAMVASVPEFRDAVAGATSTTNREAAVYETPKGGLLVLVVQSAVEDDVLDQVFATLANSAPRQFTGTRAGMFWVALQGMDADSLLSVAGQDNDPGQPPTGLALEVSHFLSSDAPDYLVGVVFGSRSGLVPAVNGDTDSGGTAYYFPKRESSMWSECFSGLFSTRR